MLDAFIIEEIRRRERVRQEHERPLVELPLPADDDRSSRQNTHDEEEKPSRGVIVIDMAAAGRAH